MRLQVRTQVLIWLCALTTIAYIQRNLGVVEGTLREQTGLDKVQSGLIQSSFFWSYALFQIPTAWLCHRWGPRVSMSIFCLAWSLATGLTGLTNDLRMLCFIRFLMGVGQAAALPCLAEVVATWFPVTHRGRASAWVTAFMQVGALLNALGSAPLVSQYSLAGYFWLLSIPGVIWSIGFFWWYRDHPQQFTALTERESNELPPPPQHLAGSDVLDWGVVLTSPILLLISAQQVCRAAGYIFFGTWFTTYMKEARGYDPAESGVATGCAFVGVLLGSLVGGTVSDWILIRTGSVRLARQGVSIVSLSLCAVCIAGFFFIRGEGQLVNIIAVTVMSVGAFFASIAGPLGYTVTIDIAGKHVGAVFGWMNMAGNLGAAAFTQVVPLLLGKSRNQWDLVFVVFVLLYVSAAVFWSLIDTKQTIFGPRDNA